MVAGRALHVHEHDAGPVIGGDCAPWPGRTPKAVMSLMIEAPALSAWRATSALVVSIESGIDSLAGERLDDRDHPAQLFVERNRLGPWAARFAPEIEHVGPFGREPASMSQRPPRGLRACRRRKSCRA